jgi:hypothetical protein
LQARIVAKDVDNATSNRTSQRKALLKSQGFEPDDMLLISNSWPGNYMGLSAAAAMQPTTQLPVSTQEKARPLN